MSILVSKTFERFEQHPEGADVCEADDMGFRSEHEAMTFRELVEALRYGEASCWPARGDTGEWVTHHDSNNGTRDYFESGATENESLHYSRQNPARNARWWRLAFRVAGLIKV